jgi:hypothetical protein
MSLLFNRLSPARRPKGCMKGPALDMRGRQIQLSAPRVSWKSARVAEISGYGKRSCLDPLCRAPSMRLWDPRRPRVALSLTGVAINATTAHD